MIGANESHYQKRVLLPDKRFLSGVFEHYDDWLPGPDELEGEYGITVDDLNKPAHVEAYMDAWCRADSPNAKVFYLLDSLDIGSELRHGDQFGGLIFYDGPMPGGGYLAVHAECGATLSLLQHRLNELNTGIGVLTV